MYGEELVTAQKNYFGSETYKFGLSMAHGMLRDFFREFYRLGDKPSLTGSKGNYPESVRATHTPTQQQFISDLFDLDPDTELTAHKIEQCVNHTVERIEELIGMSGSDLLSLAKRLKIRLLDFGYDESMKFLASRGTTITINHELWGFMENAYVNVKYVLVQKKPPIVRLDVEIRQTRESCSLSQEGLSEMEQLIKRYATH